MMASLAEFKLTGGVGGKGSYIGFCAKSRYNYSMVRQRKRLIRNQRGFNSSFDAPSDIRVVILGY